MKEKSTKESKTRSKRITSYSTIKNGLTSQNICEIIEQCGKSGVATFSLGDLTLSFKASDKDMDYPADQSPGPVTAISPTDYADFIQQDEINEKEEEVAEMKLQDPLQYEELLAQREFE